MGSSRKKTGSEESRVPSGAQPEGGLKFEQALERLEKIVAEMESAELPLDDVLKRYEEGTRLVRFCAKKLEEAEKQIEILAKAKDGGVTTELFEADEPARSPAGSKAKEAKEDREGKLF